LLNDVFDGISIATNAALVNVVTDKNDLSYYRRVIGALPLLIDTPKLCLCEGSDHHQPRSFPALKVFEIGANQPTRLV